MRTIEALKNRIRARLGRLKRKILGADKPKVPALRLHAPQIKPKPDGKPFRVAVIGAGRQGRSICRGTQTIEGVDLVAVADRSEASITRLRSEVEFDGTRFYTDIKEMLEKEHPDLVSIATYADSHVELSDLCIDCGVTMLLVEKPLSNCSLRGRELAERCERANVLLAVNHSRRWSGDYQAIKKYIDCGEIGRLRSIYVAFGRGGVAMNGVHYFDLARYLTGSEVDSVIAKFSPDQEQKNLRGDEFEDPEGYAILFFKDGSRASLDFSADLARKEGFMILKTEYGRIEIDERARTWTICGDMWRHQVPFSDETRRTNYTPRILENLFNDGDSLCGGWDGVHAVEIVTALHISDSENQVPVRLPLDINHQSLTMKFP